MLARNVTVHLWMGTSPDSHFQMPDGLSPTELRWILDMDDTESTIKGLL